MDVDACMCTVWQTHMCTPTNVLSHTHSHTAVEINDRTERYNQRLREAICFTFVKWAVTHTHFFVSLLSDVIVCLQLITQTGNKATKQKDKTTDNERKVSKLPFLSSESIPAVRPTSAEPASAVPSCRSADWHQPDVIDPNEGASEDDLPPGRGGLNGEEVDFIQIFHCLCVWAAGCRSDTLKLFIHSSIQIDLTLWWSQEKLENSTFTCF